jgi:YebC/PmpR family DNA-binding regulatory protein
MGRKSAKIAVRKGAADKARGQIYTRALKDVFKASKSGKADLAANFLLKVAVERAKKLNVPKDNIDKAIKKGQGSDGVGFEDISYEGYGPGGIAIFVESSTDNPTRTVANVRNHFKKCDGSLGVSGSLEFIFKRKAVFIVPEKGINEDEFTLHMIDAGAEEVEKDEDTYAVSGDMESFGVIQEKLQEINITPDEASIIREPVSTKAVTDEEILEKFDKLIDLLEEDDDVVAVYHNLEPEAE